MLQLSSLFLLQKLVTGSTDFHGNDLHTTLCLRIFSSHREFVMDIIIVHHCDISMRLHRQIKTDSSLQNMTIMFSMSCGMCFLVLHYSPTLYIECTSCTCTCESKGLSKRQDCELRQVKVGRNTGNEELNGKQSTENTTRAGLINK